MKSPEYSPAPTSFGIKQTHLSVEVLDEVRRIYSGITGKDITRKPANGCLLSRVDFLLHPDTINSRFAWGYPTVECYSGSEVSPETKLVVGKMETGKIVFQLDPGQESTRRDQRPKKMIEIFNAQVNQYLAEQGFAEENELLEKVLKI